MFISVNTKSILGWVLEFEVVNKLAIDCNLILVFDQILEAVLNKDFIFIRVSRVSFGHFEQSFCTSKVN